MVRVVLEAVAEYLRSKNLFTGHVDAICSAPRQSQARVANAKGSPHRAPDNAGWSEMPLTLGKAPVSASLSAPVQEIIRSKDPLSPTDVQCASGCRARPRVVAGLCMEGHDQGRALQGA